MWWHVASIVMYLEVVFRRVGGNIFLIMDEFLAIQAIGIKVICLHCTNVSSLLPSIEM